jgi:hypothetical protein
MPALLWHTSTKSTLPAVVLIMCDLMTCSPAGSTCVNGACCPTSKTCGSATNKRCCAADRQCDPITGQCCLIGGVLPGGGCCNPASVCGPNCCQTGQSCLGQQICCSQANICGSSCCMAGQTCLQSGNTGVCCGAGQIVCAGQCCTGQCIGSVCCSDPSLVCGQTCCQAGSQCLLGRCCPATQVCNQQCCPSGSVCINNQCAPPGSTPCGMSFCLAGEGRRLAVKGLTVAAQLSAETRCFLCGRLTVHGCVESGMQAN